MTLSRRSFVGVLAGGAGAALLPSAPASAAGWQLLGVHPQAAQQPTAVGRTIRDLEVFQNHLFAGFGDFENNSGPIGINPYSLTTRTFAGEKWRAYSHQIGVWRIYSGTLVTPTIDPLGDGAQARDPRAGIDWSSDGLTWHHRAIAPALHMFDFAIAGSNRWVVGSDKTTQMTTAGPTVWRSSDNGATWGVSMHADNNPNSGTDRYYWIAEVDGAPYIQATGTQAIQPIRTFRNGNWVGLATTGEFHPSGQPNHVQTFDGRILSCGGYGIRSFDPTTLTMTDHAMPDGLGVRDLYVTGSEVFAMTATAIYLSSDLATWQNVAPTPPGATSMAVPGGRQLFAGTTGSTLLEFTS